MFSQHIFSQYFALCLQIFIEEKKINTQIYRMIILNDKNYRNNFLLSAHFTHFLLMIKGHE